MKVKCPCCGYVEDVPEEYIGETGICDVCGHEFVIGGIDSSSYIGGDKRQKGKSVGSRVKSVENGATTNKSGSHVLLFGLICGIITVVAFAFAERLISDRKAYRRTSERYVSIRSFESAYNESRKTGAQTFCDGWVYEYEPNLKAWRQGEFKKLKIISIVDGGLFSDDGAIVMVILNDFDLGEMPALSSFYYISGIDKSRLVDGDSLPSCKIIANGTYSYTSANGAIRTVKAFRLLHGNKAY